MRKVIVCFICLFLSWTTYWNSEIEDIVFNLNWNDINWIDTYEKLDEIFDKQVKSLDEKKELYEEMIEIYKKKELYNKIRNKYSTKKINKNIINIKNILNYWYEKVKIERNNFYSQIQRITLWYTKQWKEIYAYYKWKPEDWYFWVFSNIHWWYEYWTYNTALYIKDKLEESWKTWWFIIPTINPEWLEYFLENGNQQDYYIKWRANSNNVDINRNFCTSNFILKEYVKKWETIKTWIEKCESEVETQIVIETLKKYKFNKVISLHSKWSIIFLPDNSFNDQKIIDFWNEVSNLLNTYLFDIDYVTDKQKKQKIYEYEIDEWWSSLFTWTMETYIYEQYNIPVVLIELAEYWKIEYKFKDIVDLID